MKRRLCGAIFIGQCVYDFWLGIHCLFTIWDGNPETEEEAFDDKGQPWTFYDEAFITRLCALAADYGLTRAQRKPGSMCPCGIATASAAGGCWKRCKRCCSNCPRCQPRQWTPTGATAAACRPITIRPRRK